MDCGWIIVIMLMLALVASSFFCNHSRKSEKEELMLYYREHLIKHEWDMARSLFCPYCELDKEHRESVSLQKKIEKQDKKIEEERMRKKD